MSSVPDFDTHYMWNSVQQVKDGSWIFWSTSQVPTNSSYEKGGFTCPYGQVGDRLWVRETFVLEYWEDEPKAPADRPMFHYKPADPMNEYDSEHWKIPHYKATDPAPDLYYGDIDENDDGEPKCKWRPSIFMPRWASRITLEISDVWCERLKDITEADACAEGVDNLHLIFKNGPSYRDTYADLWDRLNKKRGAGWETNPYVWVVEFKRVQ
jgi:hypothetical protein